MTHRLPTLSEEISWIRSFVKKADASDADWKQYDTVSKTIGECLRKQTISADEKFALKEAYGAAMTPQTLQGFVLTKPHGYAGDYEIIDKFYTQYTSPDEGLAKWDHYLHSFPAVKAVRNRKTYIKELLKKKLAQSNGTEPFYMLNLASGPARDLYEFFSENLGANLSVDCVDLDKEAIGYATKLLGEHTGKVRFHHKNILRFTVQKQYDLVWSAGLFDYFNDDVFKRLVSRFLKNIKPGGELVIGNFCSSNPDMAYMELVDWVLYHRNAEHLTALVTACGVAREKITIEKEPEAVNLFVRIKK